MPVDLASAQKKLRQAEFFLAHLHHAAEVMSMQLRRTTTPNTEVLEFWCRACLSAAQSVYYVLEETGGAGVLDIATGAQMGSDTTQRLAAAAERLIADNPGLGANEAISEAAKDLGLALVLHDEPKPRGLLDRVWGLWSKEEDSAPPEARARVDGRMPDDASNR